MQYKYWLFIPLFIMASGGAVLFAQDAGEIVVKRGTIEEDMYVAGRSVDVAAQVQGDVTVAGQRVNIDQLVTGDVMAAGENVTVRARVGDDVRAAGRTVTIAGSVAGHVVAAGETVDITSAATIGGWAWLAGREVYMAGKVGGELKAAGQLVIISGEIGNDVTLMAEEIRILASARINGNLIYRSENEPDIAEGAGITGDIIAKPVLYKEREGRGAGIIFLAALAVAGMVYFLLFPTFSLAGARVLRQSPFTTLGVGVAFLFATPFVILLLFVTVVGMLVAMPLFAWYLLSLLGGFLTGVIYVGDAGLRLAGKADAGKGMRVLSIVIALLALVLIQIIPVLGTLAMFALFLLGLGALQLQTWRRYTRV
ncbi:MAG: polymer-forming cytoskeletal protein [Gammaproteobacteria bacterium]